MALTDYTKTIELDPKNALALERRSQVFRAKGNIPRSNQDEAAALQIDPNVKVYFK